MWRVVADSDSDGMWFRSVLVVRVEQLCKLHCRICVSVVWLPEQYHGYMWRRTVQLVGMVIVQSMCCWILLSDARLAVAHQCDVSIWARVPYRKLERDVSCVRRLVFLPVRHG